jgi:hypothetical protein
MGRDVQGRRHGDRADDRRDAGDAAEMSLSAVRTAFRPVVQAIDAQRLGGVRCACPTLKRAGAPSVDHDFRISSRTVRPGRARMKELLGGFDSSSVTCGWLPRRPCPNMLMRTPAAPSPIRTFGAGGVAAKGESSTAPRSAGTASRWVPTRDGMAVERAWADPTAQGRHRRVPRTPCRPLIAPAGIHRPVRGDASGSVPPENETRWLRYTAIGR